MNHNITNAHIQPMMEVIAPANLPEGYTFQVEVPSSSNNATDTENNSIRTFTVTVPKGGIEEGQSFSVPLPGGSDALDDSMIRPRVSIPVGHWRDGVLDICKYGPFHPLLWNSFCCVPIVTAQVASRLRLDWCGRPGQVSETAGTFQFILYAVTFSWVIDRILAMIIFGTFIEDDERYDYYARLDEYIWLYYVKNFLSLMYYVCSVIFLCKIRKSVREKYAIPEHKNCPSGVEDFCCAAACSCCAVAQLARHTADYDTYRGVCCSETGLPSHVPAIV